MAEAHGSKYAWLRLWANEACSIGCLGDLAVVVPKAMLTPETIGHIRSNLVAFAEKRGRRIAVLFVVGQAVPLPSHEGRQAAIGMLRRLGEIAAVLAVVLEGTGAAATMKRTIFSMVSTVIKGKLAISVHGELRIASGSLGDAAQAHGCEMPPAYAIVRFVHELRGESRYSASAG